MSDILQNRIFDKIGNVFQEEIEKVDCNELTNSTSGDIMSDLKLLVHVCNRLNSLDYDKESWNEYSTKYGRNMDFRTAYCSNAGEILFEDKEQEALFHKIFNQGMSERNKDMSLLCNGLDNIHDWE